MNTPTPGRAAARCHGPRAGTAAGRLLALALTLVGATTAFADASKVDGAFIRANARTSHDWPSYGLDYAETRFSKLQQVNTGNVKDLGLVWSYDLESKRGVEATPEIGRAHV